MALDFPNSAGGSGVGNYLDFGDVTFLDGLSEFSFSCWIWIDTYSPGGNSSIVRKDGTATPLQHNGGSGTINCALWASGLVVHTGPTEAQVTTGAWHHYEVTWLNSRGSVRFYVDGSLVVTSSGSSTGTLANSANALRYGATESANEGFDGKLAEVGFWNREHVADEVTILSKAFCPLFVPRGILCYTPLVRPITNWYGTSPTATGTAVVEHPRIIYPGRPQISHKAPAGGGGLSIPVALHNYRRRRVA